MLLGLTLSALAWVPMHREFWHTHFPAQIRTPTSLPRRGLNLYVDHPYHSTDLDVSINLTGQTAWVENYVGPPTPGVHPIPIGIPSGTWKRHGAAFMLAVGKSPSFSAKPTAAYNNAHFVSHDHASERKALLRNRDIDHAVRRTNAPAFWHLLAGYAFVLSPRGHGIDCHRTWEALSLNTVPIVRSGPLDALHREFPIAIVDSWDDVNRSSLMRWRERFLAYDWPSVRARLDAGNAALRVLA